MAGDLAGSLIALDKLAIGRTISVFEDERDEAIAERARILDAVRAHPDRRAGFTVGLTGAPGVGKSSLVRVLAERLLAGDREPSVAVLAVDPTSVESGGALLGDRARMEGVANAPRLFFRSQASNLNLGGVGRSTYSVSRLLTLLFDYLIVETVGTGQNEIDVAALADATYLVVQPMTGDQLQFMKAGIMEVPDAIVVNKIDLPGGEATVSALRAGDSLIRAGSAPVVLPVCAADRRGVDDLAADVEARRERGPKPQDEKENYFFRRWVLDQFGRHGLGLLEDQEGGAPAYLKKSATLEAAQARLSADLRRWIVD